MNNIKTTMKRLVSLFCFVSLFSLCSQAQSYQWAVGLRAGSPEGITVKKALGESAAFEGILSVRPHGFMGTALYELHNPFLNEDGFQWYYGVGGHAGSWDKGPLYYNGYDDSYVLGVDGILGLEYTFSNVPFNVGLDWKPAYNLAEYAGADFSNVALSIRFTFNSAE